MICSQSWATPPPKEPQGCGAKRGKTWLTKENEQNGLRRRSTYPGDPGFDPFPHLIRSSGHQVISRHRTRAYALRHKRAGAASSGPEGAKDQENLQTAQDQRLACLLSESSQQRAQACGSSSSICIRFEPIHLSYQWFRIAGWPPILNGRCNSEN